MATGAINYNNTDLDNMAKGVIDAAQNVVFPNDAWIDEMYAIRCMSPTDSELLVLRIAAVEKEWFAYKALGLALKQVQKHGIIDAIRIRLERIRHGQTDT